MKQVIFFLLFISSTVAVGQNQANIWYFGDGAGIDFSNGAPVSISGGQTYNLNSHSEGTSVICDNQGQLLCYSNGEKIWNKNHNVMPAGNGLMGHFSSTQSSLLVPVPGSDKIIYLFTTDSYYINNLANGFRYSVIDMCLDNENGDIINNQKNILLLDTVAEKLTVVKHANNKDYWIITHKYNSNEFYAYLLTQAGITDTVITAIGSYHEDNCAGPSSDPFRASIGYLKASPDGSRIANVLVNTCDNVKELFDFNNSTGLLTNYIDLDILIDTFGGYGLSFSPDNSKLYYTNTKNVFQYNLNAGGGDPDSIRSSLYQVTPFTDFTNEASHSLQIGPDGKIYVSRYSRNFLAVINNPNLPGALCSFSDSAVSLDTNYCSMGLPNLNDGYNYHNKVVNCKLDISRYKKSNNLSIHPNPVQGWTMIKFDNPHNEEYNIAIVNQSGRVVKSYKSITANNFLIKDIDIIPGVYFVQLSSKNGPVNTEKIIIE